jgi:gliding motility-associated-like protein
MGRYIYLFIAFCMCAVVDRANGQSGFLEIKHTPDTCVDQVMGFYLHTNLLVENVIGWDFGDPSSGASNNSQTGNPLHRFGSAGIYQVTCIVQINCGPPTDPNNPIGFPCFYIDTASVMVEVVDCNIYVRDCMVYIPNAFTPNGDGRNDVFFPTIACNIDKFRLEIRDRWGRCCFVALRPEDAWDGLSQGIVAPEGVYVYTLETVDTWRKRRVISGVLSLIR